VSRLGGWFSRFLPFSESLEASRQRVPQGARNRGARISFLSPFGRKLGLKAPLPPFLLEVIAFARLLALFRFWPLSNPEQHFDGVLFFPDLLS